MDLVSHRYPGRRPSDIVDGLDEVQAFELDSSLALKYWLREKDEENALYDGLISYMWGFLQSQSKKSLSRPKPHKQLLHSNSEIERLLSGKKEELPAIEDLRKALISPGTVVMRG